MEMFFMDGQNQVVTRDDAEHAVRTLLIWAGDDPNREGLIDTPARVVKAYEEFFSGYRIDPDLLLLRTFEEVAGYNDIIVLRNISFHSHCEHHVVPVIGVAHIAYLPAGRVVGVSKLARVVEVFARRLQTQEAMTSQIAKCIERALQPRGVAVIVEAQHQCMSSRGVKKDNISMTTRILTGTFESDRNEERRLYALLGA